jgi:glutathione synthase/RimK-type ligase-like ATP-grasp enzyme
MKKIGILFGKENSFPPAFVERVNSKGVKGVEAEFVKVEELVQGKPSGYAVIIDRISQDVPFYRAYLKNAALTGTAVINNPFWWSMDEKFFNNCLSEQIKVPVPKTVLLPSNQRPDDTSEMSFRNMKFPLDWEMMVDYLGGFPLYMKPHSGGGWKSVYKVTGYDDLFAKYNETGQLVMMLQENIDFDAYFRCYYLGGDRVRVMPYEPRNPHHLRYIEKPAIDDPKLMKEIHKLVLKINHALGYEFNTVEFAVRGGIPYAIDYCNPAPDADLNSVGAENFEWVVENAAEMAIEKALEHKANKSHVNWGGFIKSSVEGKIPKS